MPIPETSVKNKWCHYAPRVYCQESSGCGNCEVIRKAFEAQERLAGMLKAQADPGYLDAMADERAEGG